MRCYCSEEHKKEEHLHFVLLEGVGRLLCIKIFQLLSWESPTPAGSMELQEHHAYKNK